MSTLPPSSHPTEPPEPPEPSHGYQVPPGFGGPSLPGGSEPAYDLLVPPPYGGLRPAWERLNELLRRCGKPVMAILLLTFAVPQIVQAWIIETMAEGVATAGGGLFLPAEDAAPGEIVLPAAGMIAWLIASFVVVALIGAIGWGAGIWAVTQSGAGLPVTVGEALMVGVRRLVPMFGWYVLYLAMGAIGALLCLLPGLYLLVAGSLFSFAVIYQRGRNPIGRSFSLVHSAFGAVLGRVVLLVLAMAVVFCAVGLCAGLVGIGEAGTSTGARLAGDVVMSLLLVPVYTVLLVGLLLTYTQVRARQETISTAALWAAANEDQFGGPPGYQSPVQPG